MEFRKELHRLLSSAALFLLTVWLMEVNTIKVTEL